MVLCYTLQDVSVQCCAWRACCHDIASIWHVAFEWCASIVTATLVKAAMDMKKDEARRMEHMAWGLFMAGILVISKK